MPVYEYKGNKRADDYTVEIVPDPKDPDRKVGVGGQIELSEEEAESLRSYFNLREVKDSEESGDSGESGVSGDDAAPEEPYRSLR